MDASNYAFEEDAEEASSNISSRCDETALAQFTEYTYKLITAVRKSKPIYYSSLFDSECLKKSDLKKLEKKSFCYLNDLS